MAGNDAHTVADEPATGEGQSQFSLLLSRRLGPLFITQFLGAFNDNVFKQALILILVFGTLTITVEINFLVNAAAALFVLPFFLFSATAGALADRFEKSFLIRKVKIFEICVAVLAAIALVLQNVFALLFVLFLLGAQSTFFGPLKFSILPQHLRQSELIGGNGVIEMGTFVAILLGTLVGGVIAGLTGVTVWLISMVLIVAVCGYVSSRFIPKAMPANDKEINWNPFTETVNLVRFARAKRSVFQSILGVSWFWLIGSIYIAQLAKLTEAHLHGTESVVTMILCVFTIAIAVGSLLCEKLSGRRIEIGLVPVGAAGISLFGFDSYWAINAIEPGVARNALDFLQADGAWRLLIDLGLMGVFAGVYVVPLQTLIQSRTPLDRRARVIAAGNILNAIFMVVGSVLAILWLTWLEFSIPSLFMAVAILNAFVAAYIFHNVPEFSMRFLVWCIFHTMYRVRHAGLENIPDRGAAIIVCNHVSYVDAVLLGGAVPRPIRFVMDRSVYDKPVLNFIFRVARAIPIVRREVDEEAYDQAFVDIREGLEDGDLLCIFPEGRLSPNGDMMEFRPGIEKILKETPVPVIPMALSGLWGSFFSHYGGGLFKTPNRFWSRVKITAAAPIEAAEATVLMLQDRVIELRGDWK